MRDSIVQTIFDAKGATGTGKVIDCQDYRHAIFFLATDGGSDANFTLKFQGSIGKGLSPNEDTAPTFSSAASVTNMWDYIEVVDLEDGAAIDGDTGISAAGADDYRMVQANVDGLKYLTATITARSQGEVTVMVRLFNNS